MKACCAAGGKEDYDDVSLENKHLDDILGLNKPLHLTDIQTKSKHFRDVVFKQMLSELADDFKDDLILSKDTNNLVLDSAVNPPVTD